MVQKNLTEKAKDPFKIKIKIHLSFKTIASFDMNYRFKYKAIKKQKLNKLF